MNNLEQIKKILTPYDVGHTKIRIGPREDGGYVLSRDCLEQTDLVYSLGVGPNCQFDVELANRGFTIYQYEAAYAAPVVNHQRFVYKQMIVDSNNFTKAVIANGHYGRRMLLAMDIESGEYELLLNTPQPLLEQFNQIVLEVHDVLHNPQFPDMIDVLNRSFVLTHIHANNYCVQPGAYSSGLVDGVPNVMELTYINRRWIFTTPRVSRQACPDPELDAANAVGWPDVKLDWWLTFG